MNTSLNIIMWLAWKFGAEFLEGAECDAHQRNTARFFPIGTLLSFSGDLFLGTSGGLNRVGELTSVNRALVVTMICAYIACILHFFLQ